MSDSLRAAARRYLDAERALSVNRPMLGIGRTRLMDYLIERDEAREQLEAAAASPADPPRDTGGELEAELLARALVTSFRDRGAKDKPWLKADGWPAYYEQGQQPLVLIVNELAEALAAEYERLRAARLAADQEAT